MNYSLNMNEGTKTKKQVAKSKYFTSVNTAFKFEEWMIAGSDHTVHALGAAFALAGIKDDEFIRISAAQQKTLFGSRLIGNKAISLRNGQFLVFWTSGFGGDFETQRLTEIMANVIKR